MFSLKELGWLSLPPFFSSFPIFHLRTMPLLLFFSMDCQPRFSAVSKQAFLIVITETEAKCLWQQIGTVKKQNKKTHITCLVFDFLQLCNVYGKEKNILHSILVKYALMWESSGKWNGPCLFCKTPWQVLAGYSQAWSLFKTYRGHVREWDSSMTLTHASWLDIKEWTVYRDRSGVWVRALLNWKRFAPLWPHKFVN